MAIQVEKFILSRTFPDYLISAVPLLIYLPLTAHRILDTDIMNTLFILKFYTSVLLYNV